MPGPGVLTHPPGRSMWCKVKYCTLAGGTSSVQRVRRDQLTKRLADVGRKRAEAMEAKREASEELATLIPQAHRAGVGVTEIVKLTGVSKRGVYDFLEGK